MFSVKFTTFHDQPIVTLTPSDYTVDPKQYYVVCCFVAILYVLSPVKALNVY